LPILVPATELRLPDDGAGSDSGLVTDSERELWARRVAPLLRRGATTTAWTLCGWRSCRCWVAAAACTTIDGMRALGLVVGGLLVAVSCAPAARSDGGLQDIVDTGGLPDVDGGLGDGGEVEDAGATCIDVGEPENGDVGFGAYDCPLTFPCPEGCLEERGRQLDQDDCCMGTEWVVFGCTNYMGGLTPADVCIVRRSDSAVFVLSGFTLGPAFRGCSEDERRAVFELSTCEED
jgi:hypothetical protein